MYVLVYTQSVEFELPYTQCIQWDIVVYLAILMMYDATIMCDGYM